MAQYLSSSVSVNELPFWLPPNGNAINVTPKIAFSINEVIYSVHMTKKEVCRKMSKSWANTFHTPLSWPLKNLVNFQSRWDNREAVKKLFYKNHKNEGTRKRQRQQSKLHPAILMGPVLWTIGMMIKQEAGNLSAPFWHKFASQPILKAPLDIEKHKQTNGFSNTKGRQSRTTVTPTRNFSERNISKY